MYKQALCHSKITRPVGQGLIKRTGLFYKLNNCCNCRLVWIGSPAGYGKTSLAASYLEEYDRPHLWLRLDKEDNNPSAFFSYLRFAAIKLAPGSAAELLPKFSADSLLDLKNFCKDFFAALFDVLPPSTHIILDSYQKISPDSPLHETIIDSTNRMTTGARIFFLSRSAPPLAFARLKTYGTMKVFKRKDLKVNREEFKELLKNNNYSSMPSKFIHVFNQLDGWITGINLLIELNNPMICESGEFSSEAWEDIFSFFACEIFDPLPTEQKTFLLKISFLPHITSQTARIISAEQKAGWILSNLNNYGHFCEKTTNNSQPTYQIHPMFREFLKFTAQETFSSQQIEKLSRAAATLLVKDGHFAEASQLLQEAKDWRGLYKLISEHSPALIEQGMDEILCQWLNVLPQRYFTRHPFLYYLHGISLLSRNPSESRTHLTRAYTILKGKNKTNTLLTWSAVVESVVNEHCNLSLLTNWLDEFTKISEGHIPAAIELQVAGSLFAALMYSEPMSPAINKWRTRLLGLIEESNDQNQAIISGCHLGEYYIRHGESGAASNLLGRLKEKIPRNYLSLSAHLHLLYFQANYALSAGRTADSRSMVELGVRIGKDTGVNILAARFHALALYGSLLTSDGKSAATHQKKLAAGATYKRSIDSSRTHFFAAWQAANENNFFLAHELLQTALRLAISGGEKSLEGIITAAIGHILIEFRQYNQAHDHLRQADKFARQARIPNLDILTGFIKAYLALQQDEKEIALRYLQNSLDLTDNTSRVFFPWQTHSLLIPLALLGLENDMGVDFFHDLIRRLQLTPPSQLLADGNWPWPIKIYTLGRFELVKDGMAIKFTRKAQQKPLDLLKCLLALGGRKICKFKLANILWPDADGDLQHRSLATTLHRLRKLLNRHDAIIFRNSKLTVNPDCCWVDTWAFERLVSRAEASAHADPVISAITAEKAIDIYKGAFLPQESEEPWTITLREKLRNRFLSCVEKFGNHLSEIGKNEEAIARFRKAIDVDPLAERFYQHLLACYKKMDRKAEAIILYNCCQQMMLTMLNSEPSAKTDEIFRSLNQSTKPDRKSDA